MRKYGFLLLLALPGIAFGQVRLSFDSNIYLPGQEIYVSCAMDEPPDFKVNNLRVMPYLLSPDGGRRERGGLSNFDGRRSAGGVQFHTLEELQAGTCGNAYAPLVPGNYEYEVRWNNRPEKLFTILVTVSDLPEEPGAITFLRNYIKSNSEYSSYSLTLQADRCYPTSLNSRRSWIVVIDRSAGRIFWEWGLPGTQECKGKCEHTIDQYNCALSGTFEGRVIPPAQKTPGEWEIALITADKNVKPCKSGCYPTPVPFDPGEFAVVAATPLLNTPPEPQTPGKLFFERLGPDGPVPTMGAAIGEQVRLVLIEPESTDSRTVSLSYGGETREVVLTHVNGRLESAPMTLALERDK